MCCSGLSCKLVIALGFSIFLFIAEGINYSQLAPFFPNEAEVNKGVSKFLVGVISSCFDFSTLVFSLLLPLCAKPQLNKFFFVWGAIIGAIANMGFGMLGEGQGWYQSVYVQGDKLLFCYFEAFNRFFLKILCFIITKDAMSIFTIKTSQ